MNEWMLMFNCPSAEEAVQQRHCSIVIWRWQHKVKWPSNVVQGYQKWHQSKYTVYDFLLVVCNNVCPIMDRDEKFDIKQSIALEISPRSSTMYVSFKSSRVISYSVRNRRRIFCSFWDTGRRLGNDNLDWNQYSVTTGDVTSEFFTVEHL